MKEIDCRICGERHPDGIGGTRLVRILGLVPGTNALDVFHEMTRPPQPETREESIDLLRGHALEDMARAMFWEHTGWKGRATRGVMTHPDYPACQAHTDFEIFADADRVWQLNSAPEWMRGTGVGETKCPRSGVFQRVLDENLRQRELVQAYFYGGVTRRSWACMNYFSLEHNAGPTLAIPVKVESDMATFLLKAAQRFMDEHVEPRVPPDPSEWELLAREDAPKLVDLEGDLILIENEEALRLGREACEARDLRIDGQTLEAKRKAAMLDWMHGARRRRIEVKGIDGKFTIVQSEGRDSFTAGALKLARPLDWDLVRRYLLDEGHAESTVDAQLLEMQLDLDAFMRRSDPFEYLLIPKRKEG